MTPVSRGKRWLAKRLPIPIGAIDDHPEVRALRARAPRFARARRGLLERRLAMDHSGLRRRSESRRAPRHEWPAILAGVLTELASGIGGILRGLHSHGLLTGRRQTRQLCPAWRRPGPSGGSGKRRADRNGRNIGHWYARFLRSGGPGRSETVGRFRYLRTGCHPGVASDCGDGRAGYKPVRYGRISTNGRDRQSQLSRLLFAPTRRNGRPLTTCCEICEPRQELPVLFAANLPTPRPNSAVAVEPSWMA